MRPLNLKMSAFGPYAGHVEIPMDKLGSNGLYLITGDTGAGKTTIFDAICFALFGAASGSNRKDTSMFRSKYADSDTPTEVELTFLHGGKEYYVRRNPEYLRPKKSGEGWTKQVADAEFKTPDGHVYTKVKDVTAAIEGLLGINKDQFTQIAMLAQGEFLKLLLADTTNRQDIFREIFKTGYYQTLQFKLKEKRKEVCDLVEDGKKSVDQYIRGIRSDKDDVLSIEVEKAQHGELTYEDVVELLDKLTSGDLCIKDEIDSKLQKINDELEEVNKKIGAAEGIEKARKEKEKAEKTLEKEEPELERMMEAFNVAKIGLEGKTKFEKAANTIENELPDYDEGDTLESELQTIKKDNEMMSRELEKALASQKKIEESLVALKKEQSSFTDTGAEIEKIKAKLQNIREETEAIEELHKSLEEYFKDKESYIEAQEDYRAKDATFKKVNDIYESKEQAFRDGQAGILAVGLKEGEKCPVCGSTIHPHPAKLSDKVPTEKELDIAKKESDKSRQQRDEAAKVAEGLKKSLETQEKELKKKCKKLANTEDLDEAREGLGKLTETYKKKRESEEEKLDSENKKNKRKQELDTKIPELEKENDNQRKEIEEKKKNLAAENAKAKEKEDRLGALKKGLKFENKKEAESERIKLIKQAEDLQKAYDKADVELSEQKTKILELKATVTENEKAIKATKVTDIEAERKRQRELKEEQEQFIEQSKIVSSRLNSNEEIRRNIINKAEGIAEIEKQLRWITALAKTANGDLTGKDKVMLETYIQTTYFDRIIERANLRLIKMSSGQYELIRVKEAENGIRQSGLDLGVIDHYNGTERSVKTLSGGESFIASLSLALGLSDEVQSSAGGIQIDTMFVDEGFGSLDPETLEMAYRALAGLTEGNRLVGIISHVSDLKERIDKQIVVTKEKSGGSHIKIVC